MIDLTIITDFNKFIKDSIATHKADIRPRYEKLMNYYLGKHDITKRPAVDAKPNNKIVNCYPDFIVGTVAGYMLGQPVKYISEDQNYFQEVQSILNNNNEDDHNLEMLKAFSIIGEAFELVYLDELAEICFAQLPCEQTIVFYDDSIKPKMQMVMRYYGVGVADKSGNQKYRVELYWPDRIDYYKQEGTNYVLDSSAPHYFGCVPVVHYINNKEKMGDFEKIVSLIDDYNKILSDNSNELEYFRNAYMVIKGFGDIPDEDLLRMRKTGSFLLPGVNDNEEVSFITKELDDAAIMSHLSTLEANIHKFSNIPNLTDENFAGNSSGVAIKYKLWGFEQLITSKERKFNNALVSRLQLITIALNLKGKNYDWHQMGIKFTRNLPANVLEQSQIVANLKDVLNIIPLEELFAQLSFIEDPQAAAEEVRKYNPATKPI